MIMKCRFFLAVPYHDYHRYQEFYEEGERENLLNEVSSLTEQVHVLVESCTEMFSLIDSLF